MSATATKRPFDISNSTSDGIISANSSSESSNNKKSHNNRDKPVLDEETKNKRTVQNRAAQRAFRERKERKMKELEEKVNHLESIQKQSEIESEFLRGQLFTLVKELKRFRPETSKDSEVLNYLAKHEVDGNTDSTTLTNSQIKNKVDSMVTPTNSITSLNEQENIKENIEKKKNFSFAYPFNDKSKINENYNINNNRIPSPGGSSTYSSPNQDPAKINNSNFVPNNNYFSNNFITNDSPNEIRNSSISTNNNTNTSTPSMNWLDNILYNDDMLNQQLTNKEVNNINKDFTEFDTNSTPSNLNPSSRYDSNLLTNEFNFDDQFDEQVTDFCVRMNQVCGTKQNPIPKKSLSIASSASNTPYSNLTPSVNGINITIPSSVDSSKKPSFGALSLNNSNNPFGDVPFINDSLAFQMETNDLLTQEQKQNEKTEISKQFANRFDSPDFFRTPDTNQTSNSSVFDQFLQDDDEEDSAVERDPLDALINEETSSSQVETLKNKETNLADLPVVEDDDDDSNSIVPSKDGDLLKCSEIWDRITAHPKYSDIDIDGLCGELMAKAKCSESGVVVNASDVQLALTKHMV